MPRYHQSARQLIILRLLEARQGISLQQISAHINNSRLDQEYTERTLRRDLETLDEAGYPITTERREGTTCFKLNDGFHVSLLPLTPSEMFALRCGAKLLKPLEGTFISDSIQSLIQKISANLAANQRESFDQLQKNVQLATPLLKENKCSGETVAKIKEAIEQNKRIQMAYSSVGRNRPSKKQIEPYGFWYNNGTLYLIGYDTRQKDFRTYVIDRIKSLKVTDTVFTRNLFFSMEDYFKDAFGVYRGKAEKVEFIFHPPAAKWARERRWHESQELTNLPGDKIRLTFNVAVTPEFIQWVLGFGSQVEVIQPESLKQVILKESWSLVRRYQPGTTSSKKSRNKEKIQSKVLSKTR